MKHSIYKIFKNLNMYLAAVLFVATITAVFAVEQNISFEKVNILNKNKQIMESLTHLQNDDIELLLIQFNSQSTLLHNQINKLQNLYKYNFIGRYIIGNEDEYLYDLNKLSELTVILNKNGQSYYSQENNGTMKEEFNNSFYKCSSHIDSMMIKNIFYDEVKFNLLEKMAILSFILIFFSTFWYRNRLYTIYKDILFLYSVETGKKDYKIFSEEVDAISLRMNKKQPVTDSSSMIDQVTGINNYKGLLHFYSDKKDVRDGHFRSVSVFEIDNFSKSNQAFSEELTQSILKKVAFIISLHEQPTDIIARIDYNQFAVILSRAGKDQSFKDIDSIRQNISEIKLNLPNNETITITVSGGFIIKHKNTNLEETLKQAQELLKYAKESGTNIIFQAKDLIVREL